MQSIQRNVLYFILIALAAFGIFLACQETGQRVSNPHQWLHKELSLTNIQEEKIAAIEAKHREKESQLNQNMRAANKALAETILKDRTYSENASLAVRNVHHAMGALQESTLQHLFEMQSVLDEAQAKKLRQLAADALLNAP